MSQLRLDGQAVVDLETMSPTLTSRVACVILAVIAAIAPPRPNSTSEHAGCPIELSKLGYTILRELLSSMLLAHVDHQTIIGTSSVGLSGSGPH